VQEILRTKGLWQIGWALVDWAMRHHLAEFLDAGPRCLGRNQIGDEHLRLFSEHNAQGVQASVYNVTAKTWITPSEPVDDIEQGKDRAAAYARGVSAQSRTPRNAVVRMEEIPLGVTRKDLVGSAPHQGFIKYFYKGKTKTKSRAVCTAGLSGHELCTATRLLLTKRIQINVNNCAALQSPCIVSTPSFKFFVGVFTFLTAENTNHGR
jgi:hypothetical protein